MTTPSPKPRKPPARGKRKRAAPPKLATATFHALPGDIFATLPLRLVSEANAHEHWRKRQTRAKSQRSTAATWLRQHAEPIAGPLVITMSRLAPGSLDSDNAVGACKHVRDGIADWLGIDDRDARVEWRVEQERQPYYGVRVHIVAMTAERRVADLRAQLEAAEAAHTEDS